MGRTKSWLEAGSFCSCCDLTFICVENKYKIIMFQKLGSKILTGKGKGLGLLGGAGAAAFVGTRFGVGPIRLMAESSEAAAASNFYQFKARDIDGKEVDLRRYEGQVCVVVNVASR